MNELVKTRKEKQSQFVSTGDKPARRPRRAPVAMAIVLAAALVVSLGYMALRVTSAKAVETTSAVAAVAATVGHEPYPALAVKNGLVRLPLSTIDDGAAHYFTYMNGAQPIEVFVVRGSDGQPRLAFNACDVCYRAKKGYTQERDQMVCGNCGNRFPIDQIGAVQGGCNPAPLKSAMDKGDLVIRAEDIVAGARLF